MSLSPEQLTAADVEPVGSSTPADQSATRGRFTITGMHRNPHDKPAYCDGLQRSAPKLDALRDAIEGASVLARLLRKDALILESHQVNDLTHADLAEDGAPLLAITVGGLHAALRTCLDSAGDIVEGMAGQATQAASTTGEP